MCSTLASPDVLMGMNQTSEKCPWSLEDQQQHQSCTLHTLVKTFFELKEDFHLQYMDADVNAFMNLTSVFDVKNKQKHTESNAQP